MKRRKKRTKEHHFRTPPPLSRPQQSLSDVGSWILWWQRRVCYSLYEVHKSVLLLKPRFRSARSYKPSHLISYRTYETVQAPPATTFLQAEQFQIPTDLRLTVFFPQNVQVYRACWEISIFFTCFRREAPYLLSKDGYQFSEMILYSSACTP